MRNKREIVCIQSGQAGVQLGNALWELFCIEHHISSAGILNPIESDSTEDSGTFFACSSDKQYYPRLINFDTEPTVIDEIRCGFYRKLFHPDLLISGTEDAANNFARGYFSETKKLIIKLVESVRYTIETCENFQGFLIESGTAGGTGSGLLAALTEYLVIEFAGHPIIQLSMFPGKKLSSCVVQPYNCIMMMERLIYNSDLNLIVDNEMMYSLCYNQLDIERPSYSNINRIVAPILSGLTAPIRFNGLIHSDLTDISTNLIPYPRLHFPFVSYAPLISNNKFEHDLFNTENITRSVFHSENQFIDIDLKDGYFMASVVLYRGNCDLSNILSTIYDIKKNKELQWVDWCPTGFKISHTVQTPFTVPGHGPFFHDKSAMMISNHNGIVPTFAKLQKNFRRLFSKRAYIHWYVGEGMEEEEIGNALYEVETISDDYKNIIEDWTEDKTDIISSNMTLNFLQEKDTSDKQSEEANKINDIGNHERLDSLEISPKTSELNDNKSQIDIPNKHLNEITEVKSTDSKSELRLDSTRDDNINEKTASEEKKISIDSVVNVEKYDSLLVDDSLQIKEHINSEQDDNSNLNANPLFTNQHCANYIYINSPGDSKTVTTKPSDIIFDMCQRNYANCEFKYHTRKLLLSQKSACLENETSMFQKIIRKNKKILLKLMHSKEYNFL